MLYEVITRNLISEAGREKTVMLSTHIMQEVEAICSRVIIIDHGRIVADGPIGEISVITSYSIHYTKLYDLSHAVAGRG